MSTVEESLTRSGGRSERVYRGHRYLLAGALTVGAVVVVGVGLAAFSALWSLSPKIASGVSLGGVPVGGLTRSQARARVAEALGEETERPIRLTYGLEAWTYPLGDLGADVAIEPAVGSAYLVGRRSGLVGGLAERYRTRRHGANVLVYLTFDPQRLRSALAALAADIDRPPEDARVEFDQEKVTHVPHRMGLKFDTDETLAQLLAHPLPVGATEVSLVVKEAAPEITTGDISSIDTILTTFTTRYSTGQANRSHNLALAAAALDGSLIRPGEIFSYNAAVGKRTAERGYRTAPIYAEGEEREGVGGGVCQPSSTLYNAALLANCAIMERHNHMMPVKYLPTGRDATVDYGNLDVRFKNTLSHPIWLAARAEGGSLTISALGSSTDDYDVEIVRTDVADIPRNTVEKVDETQEPGYRHEEKPGRDGHRVTVLRIVRRNGEEVRREVVSRDYYAPKDTLIIVGPQEEGSEESAPEGSPEGEMFQGARATPDRSPLNTSPVTSEESSSRTR